MTQDEAIKTVCRIFNYCEEIDCHLPEDEKTGYKMYPDIIAVKDYIRNTPEIVRCKDCKYREEYKIFGRPTAYYCLRGCVDSNLSLNENNYCCWGERKETE